MWKATITTLVIRNIPMSMYQKEMGYSNKTAKEYYVNHRGVGILDYVEKIDQKNTYCVRFTELIYFSFGMLYVDITALLCQTRSKSSTCVECRGQTGDPNTEEF